MLRRVTYQLRYSTCAAVGGGWRHFEQSGRVATYRLFPTSSLCDDDDDDDDDVVVVVYL